MENLFDEFEVIEIVTNLGIVFKHMVLKWEKMKLYIIGIEVAFVTIKIIPPICQAKQMTKRYLDSC